jgi:endonuclease III related protein
MREQVRAAPGHRHRTTDLLIRYYRRMLARLGPQKWWPARTRLGVILGAILTQNTSWTNVELAMWRLRHVGFLKLSRLRQATRTEIEAAIRPAGFYRQKAQTIQTFIAWLDRSSHGSLHTLFARPPQELRRELLLLRGLGPETVDAILLYAGRKPFFVADAYTRRILSRHGLAPQGADYDAVQGLLHRNLPPDPAMFNEFHALLVEVGKRYCKRQAAFCHGCPLENFLAGGRPAW